MIHVKRANISAITQSINDQEIYIHSLKINSSIGRVIFITIFNLLKIERLIDFNQLKNQTYYFLRLLNDFVANVLLKF